MSAVCRLHQGPRLEIVVPGELVGEGNDFVADVEAGPVGVSGESAPDYESQIADRDGHVVWFADEAEAEDGAVVYGTGDRKTVVEIELFAHVSLLS